MESRPGGQLEKLLVQQNTAFTEISIGHAGSLKDIEQFLKARCPQEGGPEAYRSLIPDILSRSNGIFLWASLTTIRLEYPRSSQ